MRADIVAFVTQGPQQDAEDDAVLDNRCGDNLPAAVAHHEARMGVIEAAMRRLEARANAGFFAQPPSCHAGYERRWAQTPSMTYVIQRWREGCTDSIQRWRELRVLGSSYAARTVSRCITRLRRARAAGWAPETQTSPPPAPVPLAQ